MQHRILVKTSKDSLGQWIVQYEQYDENGMRSVPGTRSGALIGWTWDAAADSYFIDVFLPAATYRMVAQVHLGDKLAVSLRPKPVVIDPPGKDWPLVVDLSPATAAATWDVYYFRVGHGQ